MSPENVTSPFRNHLSTYSKSFGSRNVYQLLNHRTFLSLFVLTRYVREPEFSYPVNFMVWCKSVAKGKDTYIVLWSLPSEGSINSLIEEDAASWWSFMRPDFIPSGDEHPVESKSFIRRSFHIFPLSFLHRIAHRIRRIFGVYDFKWRLSKRLYCFWYAKPVPHFLASLIHVDTPFQAVQNFACTPWGPIFEGV